MKVANFTLAPRVLLSTLVAGKQSLAQSPDVPAAIYTDPVSLDSGMPARNLTVHIPAGDAKVNGVFLSLW